MSRALLWSAAVLALAAVSPVRADEAKPKAPVVEVAICLDVSGSMNGLINSAKAKLWDLVNDLGKANPTPELRVCLYSYGHTSYDKGRGWVRKDVDLTLDLDTVYQKLNELTIAGGDEYVARVCNYALDEQKWSEDPKALKLIFVAGNEPADQDKEIELKDVAQKAIKKGVIINTIYCDRGGVVGQREAPLWQEFAKMAEGRYALIDQNKGSVVIDTPQDKELAALSSKLNGTYVDYGKEGKDKKANQAAQDYNAERAGGASAAASRANAKAGGLYRNESWDLVDRLKREPNLDIKKIPEDELCEEMKKLKPEEREAFVKAKLAEREELQKKIAEVSARRDAYIKEEEKKNPNKADKAFDEAVRGALREQADKQGIKLAK